MRYSMFIIWVISISTHLSSDASLFNGFPLSESGKYSWQEIQASYQPITQLLEAIEERCAVTGVTPPEYVHTWQINVPADSTNIVEVVTTNAVHPFVVSGVTNYPHLTRGLLGELDRAIVQLASHFVQASAVTNHLGVNRVKPSTGEATFVNYALHTLMEDADAGYNYVYYATNTFPHFSITTNYVAHWTSFPAADEPWGAIAQGVLNTNTGTWNLRSYGPAAWQYSPDAGGAFRWWVEEPVPLPVFVASTNRGQTVTLAGDSVYGASTSEVVNVTGDITSLTVPWRSISSITGTNGSENTDWVQVTYTNAVTLYRVVEPPDIGSPYNQYDYNIARRLHGEVLDERYRVIKRLTYQQYSPSSVVDTYETRFTFAGESSPPDPPYRFGTDTNSYHQIMLSISDWWAFETREITDPDWDGTPLDMTPEFDDLLAGYNAWQSESGLYGAIGSTNWYDGRTFFRQGIRTRMSWSGPIGDRWQLLQARQHLGLYAEFGWENPLDVPAHVKLFAIPERSINFIHTGTWSTNIAFSATLADDAGWDGNYWHEHSMFAGGTGSAPWFMQVYDYGTTNVADWGDAAISYAGAMEMTVSPHGNLWRSDGFTVNRDYDAEFELTYPVFLIEWEFDYQ